MTTKEVIKDIIRKRNLRDSPDWTLFELCNDYGVGKLILFYFILFFFVKLEYEILINVLIYFLFYHKIYYYNYYNYYNYYIII